MHKVSIIIPVYNTENYISSCLESVLGQTLEEIEIICVNDGSKDNSAQILNTYAKSDTRIKIISYKNNMGQAYARNRGIEIANGEYIGFIDSDDMIDSNYYKYLYSRAKEYHADISSAKVMYIFNNNKKAIGNWITSGYLDGRILISTVDKIDRVYQCCSSASGKSIFSTSLIKNNKIKYLEGYLHEDQLFTIEAYYNANKIITENNDSPCYYYKIRDSSSMNINNIMEARYKKRFFDQLFIINKILEYIETSSNSSMLAETLNKYFEKIIERQINDINYAYIDEFFMHINQMQLSHDFLKRMKRKKVKRRIKNILCGV